MHCWFIIVLDSLICTWDTTTTKFLFWWRRQIKDKKNIDGHDLIVPVCRCACMCLVNSGLKIHLEFTSRSRFLPIHEELKEEESIKHHININKTKQRKEIIIKSQKEDNQVQYCCHHLAVTSHLWINKSCNLKRRARSCWWLSWHS